LSSWNIIKIETLPLPPVELISYNWLRPMG